jgi:hypothetical protein
MEQLEFDWRLPTADWYYMYMDVLGETHALPEPPATFDFKSHGFTSYLGALRRNPGSIVPVAYRDPACPEVPENWRECNLLWRGRPCYKMGTTEADQAVLEAGSQVQYVQIDDAIYVVDPWRTEWNS